tara:strand:+ start:70 stop:1401 length:1332 start_codon:yes stop_codon:yes gene_type:complete
MALTQVSTDGIKNGTISSADLGSDLKVTGSLFEVENTGGNANFEVTRVSGANFRIQSQSSLVRLDTIGASHPIMLGTNGNGRIQINDSTVDLLNDNQRLRIGAGNDLQIFHNGNNSVIADVGEGELSLQTNGTAINFWNSDGGEYIARFVRNNAVQLYHNGTKKFETTASGADIDGNLTLSGTVDGVDIATRDTLFGGLTSSSGVLTNGVTATTQTTGDNSTKVATTAYVTAAIGNATISGSQISANAIDTTKIANDAVTTDKINLISTSSVPSLEAKGDGSTDGYIQLNCSQNSHGVKLKAPPHSASASYTFTLPNDIQNGKVLSTDASGNTSWVDNYTNTSVDTHLNTGTASNNEVLSWNGSDYTWVAQSAGGGGSMNNLVEDTSPQLGGNLDMQSNNITGTGTITANSVASSANGMRKITASTSAPSGGSDGDIWVKYTA